MIPTVVQRPFRKKGPKRISNSLLELYLFLLYSISHIVLYFFHSSSLLQDPFQWKVLPESNGTVKYSFQPSTVYGVVHLCRLLGKNCVVLNVCIINYF